MNDKREYNNKINAVPGTSILSMMKFYITGKTEKSTYILFKMTLNSNKNIG